ncbi:retrovirus-related pol polyprotein from transposon TNT 1-94 [Tanacetum coccineum]
MDLCGPMRVESINGKKYVLVIIDDYSRYTWTHILEPKTNTIVLIDLPQTHLQRVFMPRIEHQTSTARRPEQNGTIERWNRTLVEAARTMLSAAKIPLFFWAEAIATAYGENLDKMKEKGDACIFVGYFTQSKDHVSSDPAPQCQATTLEQVSLSLDPQSQENVPLADETVTTSLNELDMLFSLMFDEYFNGATPVVSKSSAVPTTDASDKRQQQPDSTSSTSTPGPMFTADGNFDLLQKLVSQLELLDEKLSQEDVNQKLVRSLSPEWNTYAVV